MHHDLEGYIVGAKCGGQNKREGNVTVGTCIINTICVCNSCLAWKKLAGKWIPSTPKSRQIWLSMDWMGLKPKPPSTNRSPKSPPSGRRSIIIGTGSPSHYLRNPPCCNPRHDPTVLPPTTCLQVKQIMPLCRHHPGRLVG